MVMSHTSSRGDLTGFAAYSLCRRDTEASPCFPAMGLRSIPRAYPMSVPCHGPAFRVLGGHVHAFLQPIAASTRPAVSGFGGRL